MTEQDQAGAPRPGRQGRHGRQGSRRQARQFALQALYTADLGEGDAMPALHGLWSALVDGDGLPDHRAPESDEVAFAQELVTGVHDHRERIDALIEGSSTNWRLRRMPLVDRNILRIAAYELMCREDIPPTVSINEAIELAKRFGASESRAFVNGLVDKIGRSLGRLPARGRPGGRR